MSKKEILYQLVNRLPESELLPAARYLEFLIKCEVSKEEYDDPLTLEEAAESERAWQDFNSGSDPGVPLESVERELGLDLNA